jgi:Flp pilus assembly pilin Flp
LTSESGQTFTEYTMILGLLTAIIIGLTAIIVPGLGQAVVGLVNHMLVYMGSPAS